MRAEHWYDFSTQAGDSDLLARIIAHIVTATTPDAVLQYLRAGQVTPLAKPTGGRRPLLMMSFLRRLALKAIIAASGGGRAPARRGLPGWSQQDDQIHPVLLRRRTKPVFLSPLTSRQLFRTYPCCTASGNTILIWPRSSPDGTLAPQLTSCTVTDLTHTSRSAADRPRMPALTMRVRSGGGAYITRHPL